MTLGELLGYLGMAVGGAVPWLEAVVVIPVGIVAGLAPVPATVLAVTGNLATVVLAAVGGERLNRWWRRRRQRATVAPGPDADMGSEPAEPAAGAAEAGEASATADGGRRRGQRAARVLRRYGLPGLALAGPVVTGTQLAALAAVTAGAPRRATVWWIGAGTVGWSVGAAVATVVGVDLVVA